MKGMKRMDNIIWKCENLTMKYGKKQVLNNVSLQLERGKIIGLLGPNGSGKTTLIKLSNGLLTPKKGNIIIDGHKVGIETKKIVSYLPERPYLDNSLKIYQIVDLFQDFYEDFDVNKAYNMLKALKINPEDRLKSMSKGTKEKVQLILVMSREAKLYMLDEPIGGVDPAARDYILRTIISNYNPDASVIISTHLISDIEQVLDDVVFIKEGEVMLHKPVDEIREEDGKSVDELFREAFRC